LEEIAEQQEERIRRIIKEEKETGVKYPYLSREIQSLATLRKTIIKEREYERKPGCCKSRGCRRSKASRARLY